MSEQSFQDKQYAFAAHIRDPQHVPAPAGIDERRMSVYRNLFFNNLVSLLAQTFPVTKKLNGDDHWRYMIRQFMQRHKAQTPYFMQLPGEFVEFLENEYKPVDADFGFLLPLAHWEYIELALSVSTDDNDMVGIDPDGDLLDNSPVKSRLAWSFAYQYPVHRINEDFKPSAPEDIPIYLAIYRRGDDSIGFMELNPITAALLDAIANNDAGVSGRQLLEQLAEQAGYADTAGFIAHGEQALEDMRQQQIIIGAASAN